MNIKEFFNKLKVTYSGFFLAVIMFFSLLFLSYLFYSGYTLKQSQKQIKEYYENHIRMADSLYCNLSSYNRFLIKESYCSSHAILTDSLINKTLGSDKILSDEQYKKLSWVISEHFNQISKQEKLYSSKITQDSLRLNMERILLEGQTKSLVDLHLNKVDNEYTNITIWAAILTVIFLVFSFFSIMKTEELISQGKESIQDIKKLKEEGAESVKSIEVEKVWRLKNLEKMELDFIERYKSYRENVEKNIQQVHSELLAQYQQVDSAQQSIRNDYNVLLQSLYNQYTSIFENKIRELDNVIKSTNITQSQFDVMDKDQSNQNEKGEKENGQ